MTMVVPDFTLHRPTSLAELRAITAGLDDFDFLGGGTDLLCNYKNELNSKEHVISLTRLAELKDLSPTSIGAGVTLARLEADDRLAERLPILRETARKIASPLIRQTGTVGGNLLVDTRCYWFNQSPDFRDALGSCLKAESDECRVVPNPSVCYATYSGDLGPVLWVLGATLHLAGPERDRRLAVPEFFLPTGANRNGASTMDDGVHLDGIGRNSKQADEVIVAVEIPEASQELRVGYMKLRARDALDFPDAGVAMSLRKGASGAIESLRVVVNACAPTPLEYEEVAAPLIGTVASEDSMRAFGDRLSAAVVPHKNTWFSPKYRRRIVGVFARRLLKGLLEGS